LPEIGAWVGIPVSKIEVAAGVDKLEAAAAATANRKASNIVNFVKIDELRSVP